MKLDLKMQVPAFVPQFELKASKGDLSSRFLQLGIHTYHDAVLWAHKLPYGRNRNRADYLSIFSEMKGTCSTKHAALAALAHDYAQPVKLVMAICKLNEALDPNVKPFLQLINTEYFPEAHCFLSFESGEIDITFPEQSCFPKVEVLDSFSLKPMDIGEKKLQLHHQYIKQWMKTAISQELTFHDLWKLRESWIASL